MLDMILRAGVFLAACLLLFLLLAVSLYYEYKVIRFVPRQHRYRFSVIGAAVFTVALAVAFLVIYVG